MLLCPRIYSDTFISLIHGAFETDCKEHHTLRGWLPVGPEYIVDSTLDPVLPHQLFVSLFIYASLTC